MCENWASSTCQTGTVSAAVKRKGQEDGGEDECEIHTAVRWNLNSSQKQVPITNYFSK
jgi:hypothetical protein